MTADLVLYFPAADVPASVFQGIYNNCKDTTWYAGFPWYNYDKVDAAWAVMNQQPKIWIANESDPLAEVVRSLVGTSDYKKVSGGLIDSIEAALLSLQPGIQRNDPARIIDTLHEHMADRVCAIFE